MRTVLSVVLASTALLLSSAFSAPKDAALFEPVAVQNGSHTGGNGSTGGSSSRPTKRTAVSEGSGSHEVAGRVAALVPNGSHTGGGGQRLQS